MEVTGMEKIVYRRASIYDFEAIAKIDENIYKGMDIFSMEFPNIIKASNLIAVVCEDVVSSKLLGYVHGYVMGGGRYLVSQNRRVHPDFRRRGYGNGLHAHLVVECKKDFPLLEDCVYFTAYNAFYVTPERYAPQHEILAKRHLTQHHIPIADVTHAVDQWTASCKDCRLSAELLPIEDSVKLLSQWSGYKDRIDVLFAYHVFVGSGVFTASEIPTANPLHSIVMKDGPTNTVRLVAVLFTAGPFVGIDVHVIDSTVGIDALCGGIGHAFLHGVWRKEITEFVEMHHSEEIVVLIKFSDGFDKENVLQGLRGCVTSGKFANHMGIDLPQTVVRKRIDTDVLRI